MTPDSTDVLEALAQVLADAGIAQYRTDGMYTGTAPAVVFGYAPEQPDNVIVLNIANESTHRADKSAPDMWIHVRVRTAGSDPRTTEHLAQSIYELIDRSHQTWKTVKVRDCHRTVRAPLIQDTNRRYTRADMYQAHINS